MQPIYSILSLFLLLSGALAHPLERRHHKAKSEELELLAKAHVKSAANGIDAMFEFTGHTDGRGTFVKVRVMKGLLTSGPGPYGYHVHTNPLGPDGNCNDALGHLDPLAVSESLVCDPAFPDYCQEGDLSGKHGKLNGTADGSMDEFGYTDNFLRFFPEEFSLLGRSIVIHSANKTRLACGNIISTLDDTATSCGKASGKPSTFVTHYPAAAPDSPAQTSSVFTGDAFPSNGSIAAMPFPLPNKALAISEALAVSLTIVNSTVMVNNTSIVVALPTEIQINGTSPFVKSC